MTRQTALDDLKSVLTGTARAMTNEPEVEVGYTADAPALVGKTIKVPMPPRGLPYDRVAEARGFADAAALRIKHHSEKLHAAVRPVEPIAAACFDAMERARVEALGARAMAGVRENLSAALQVRLRSDPITRAQNRDDVPVSTAIELILRQGLTGDAPPDSAAHGLSMVSDWIAADAGPDLSALSLLIDNQKAFGEMARQALRHLDLILGDEPLDGGADDQDDGDEQDQSDDADSGDEEQSGSAAQAQARVEQQEGDSGESEEGEVDVDGIDDDDSDAGSGPLPRTWARTRGWGGGGRR